MRVEVNPACEIEVQTASSSKIHSVDFGHLQFGKVFTDHMFEANYRNGVWEDCAIRPIGPLHLHPATSALHYGQAVFEGMKAFRNRNGEVAVFRPDMNLARLNRSCIRMAIPEVPEELFMEAVFSLLKIDEAWVRDDDDASLYIRPFVFATDDFVGIKPSDTFKFIIFCCPVAKYYSKPVRVLVQDTYFRAFPGGTGAVKAAGNYGAVMMPLLHARQQGYDQMLWLDGIEKQKLQEIGTMNIFIQIGDTVITTPTDDGTILEGVTRNSCIDLLMEAGHKVEIRDVTIDEVLQAHADGKLKDAFGTGTAATVAPIGAIGYKGTDYTLPSLEERKISSWLKHALWAIRKGVDEDRFHWMWKI